MELHCDIFFVNINLMSPKIGNRPLPTLLLLTTWMCHIGLLRRVYKWSALNVTLNGKPSTSASNLLFIVSAS